jgi:hypothetical protein
METALLLILIITGNLCLYWLFFGKKKFEDKLYAQEEVKTCRKEQ